MTLGSAGRTARATVGRYFFSASCCAAACGRLRVRRATDRKEALARDAEWLSLRPPVCPKRRGPIVHFPGILSNCARVSSKIRFSFADLRVVQLDALAHLLHQPFPYLFRIRPGTLMGARRGRGRLWPGIRETHIEGGSRRRRIWRRRRDCQQTEKRKKAGLGHGSQLIGPVRSTPARTETFSRAYPACWRPPVPSR